MASHKLIASTDNLQANVARPSKEQTRCNLCQAAVASGPNSRLRASGCSALLGLRHCRRRELLQCGPQPVHLCTGVAGASQGQVLCLRLAVQVKAARLELAFVLQHASIKHLAQCGCPRTCGRQMHGRRRARVGISHSAASVCQLVFIGGRLGAVCT